MAFKKGQSGNPKGREPYPFELANAAKLTKSQVETALSKFMWLSKEEVKEYIEKPDTIAMDVLLGRIMLKAISSGDHMRMEFFFNRLIGKVQDKVEHSMPSPVIIKRKDGTEIELGVKHND